MQYVNYLAAYVAICLVVAGSSFATTKPKTSGSLNVESPVQVGSTNLAPGDYKVQWSGEGDNVKINILKGKNIVATTDGKIVEMAKPASGDAVVIKSLQNNTKAIEEIDFNNRKDSLVINPGE